VFHFVLFGMVAIRVGLGQMFIDLAHCVAGRFAGGPAKVSVLASGMMDMISGSSIANMVMTGSLTIPTMKRIGYKPNFAGAVEAAASTGGQITPPIMGSAAFLMVKFLEIPLKNVILTAIIPASMHFLGVLIMVHFEAKRLGARSRIAKADEGSGQPLTGLHSVHRHHLYDLQWVHALLGGLLGNQRSPFHGIWQSLYRMGC
jgi:TRAP-type uncharacterized transport system fused permease subunit